MNKTEFMDLLRYYFRDTDPSILQEILTDYEEHFAAAAAQGKSEEATARELGSPKDIYDAYLQEGLVEKISARSRYEHHKEQLRKGADQLYTSVQQTWDADIRPNLPSAAKKAGTTILYAVSLLSQIAAVLSILAMLAVILVFGGFTGLPLQPIAVLPPLPLLHPLTLVCAGIFGLTSAATFYFLGKECRRILSLTTEGALPQTEKEDVQ